MTAPSIEPDRSRPIEIDERGRETRGAATVRDVVLRNGSIPDLSAYLVEPTGDRAGGRVLFLHWFARADYYVARMTAHELFRAAGEPKELKEYDKVDHAMRSAEAATDRAAFLRAHLGF